MKQMEQADFRRLTDAYLDALLEDRPAEADLASRQILSRAFLRRMDQRAHQKDASWTRAETDRKADMEAQKGGGPARN